MVNPWVARAVVLAGNVMMVVITSPHRKRSHTIRVAKNKKGKLERVLVTLMAIGFLAPLIWVSVPILAFADYPLRAIRLYAGIPCLVLGGWLYSRAHADLGTNWSLTLELREEHRLVTRGIYRHIRHPMYLAVLVYGFGQALVLPNWIAGPCYGVTMALTFALRFGPEERMMLEEFGKDYEAYVGRTRRLVPSVW